MDELRDGLLISAIGMGLVFAVIIFLWGLMALMMRLTSTRKRTKKVSEVVAPVATLRVPEMARAEGLRRVVAAAVAVAMAYQEDEDRANVRAFDEPESQISAWQAAHRTRELNQTTRRG